MVDVYQSVTDPVTGESFKCVNVTDEAFVMEWIVQPKGYVPFEHIHLNQDEIFEVKEGEIRLVLEGKEIIGKAGEIVVAPKGKRHIAFNNGSKDLKCIVTYTPCLDHVTFFQCFFGLIEDGYIDKKGGVSIPRMGYFMKKMKCKALARPTSIPGPLMKVAFNYFYTVGRIKGWNKLYTKYTGLD